MDQPVPAGRASSDLQPFCLRRSRRTVKIAAMPDTDRAWITALRIRFPPCIIHGLHAPLGADLQILKAHEAVLLIAHAVSSFPFDGLSIAPDIGIVNKK